jgi:hypothetical protein
VQHQERRTVTGLYHRTVRPGERFVDGNVFMRFPPNVKMTYLSS